MWGQRLTARRADFALEISAQRAGFALACLFSSSDEFEAAIIEARRATGAYFVFRRRQIALSTIGTLTAGLIFWFA